MDVGLFRELVWAKGRELYRDMPWRDEPTFYHVLVSELMLQQTQVSRVLGKYNEFMDRFPTIADLASASLADVLRVWQGLGYNRRAKYLHEASRVVMHHGQPASMKELLALPGVGAGTAGAIMNYVYQIPTAYIETNIRTVYFNHFFFDQQYVSDTELTAMVEQTMDREHPREWFWALMDYGAELKQQRSVRLDKSIHYKKQSALAGSVRQVRGQIIHQLTKGSQSKESLARLLHADKRFQIALDGLLKDGLIQYDSAGNIELTK